MGLRLQMARLRARGDAAEPGSADFLHAYTESSRLRLLYRQLSWSLRRASSTAAESASDLERWEPFAMPEGLYVVLNPEGWDTPSDG